ncbi:zinc finger, CCHC-type containing protein [Tanacetum coccineum]
MHFLLTTLKVVYVLNYPMQELLKDDTVEAIRRRAKWESDDLHMQRTHIKCHLCIDDSLRAHESDKGKGKEVAGPSVNMTEEGGKNKNNKENKGKKRGFNENNGGSGSNKKPKLKCWKCGKTCHFKRDCRSGNKKNNENAGGSGKGSKDQSQDQDHCWFKTYEPVEDGYVLYMGDDHFAPVHGKGSVVLEFSSRKSITLFNVLYVPKLCKNLISGPVLNKCGDKQVYESDKYILSKSGVFVGFGYYNNEMFMLNLNKVPDDLDSIYMSSSSTVVNSSLWHAHRGGEYYDPVFFQSVGIIHETTSPYTPQQNSVAERKNKALKEMVNSMAIVRLPDPKRKTLGEKGIDCIFVGYAKHSKAYRFYVIEPNDSISINSIIESRDAIFNENHFSSIPRPKDIIPNVQESQMDDHTDDVPSEIHEPQKGKRVRKAKSYGFDFRRILETYNEAMQSRDAAFWKEVIDDEIVSIMENNTWVLSDLPPGCKPLGCKWIFKRKMKVDGTIDKFKARLVIQGFRQKEGIDYFDTYEPVARITTIRFKFDSSGKGVIICLYVDDMLFFGTDQNQVDETKKFLSSRFSMKDMGEADVLLGIKIKRKNKGIFITQSHYIEKRLKKFNREDCSSVNTLMDPVEKLKPNTGKPVDQLEYSRAIGCLMYAITSTRPNIAYVVGRLSRFTSNPSRQHWKAITRVFKYLRGTKDYGLSYVGYPSVLKGYSNASWIYHVEDSSFMSGWLFLLGGGVISSVGFKDAKMVSLVTYGF